VERKWEAERGRGKKRGYMREFLCIRFSHASVDSSLSLLTHAFSTPSPPPPPTLFHTQHLHAIQSIYTLHYSP
jgi:hypothetical protein